MPRVYRHRRFRRESEDNGSAIRQKDLLDCDLWTIVVRTTQEVLMKRAGKKINGVDLNGDVRHLFHLFFQMIL